MRSPAAAWPGVVTARDRSCARSGDGAAAGGHLGNRRASTAICPTRPRAAAATSARGRIEPSSDPGRLGLRPGSRCARRLRWDGRANSEQGDAGPPGRGSAIAAYLSTVGQRHDRHLFLRTTAPISGFKSGSDGIGSIVKYALARAGVDAPHRGSHQFRHALAVRLLRGGASFAEIGEVLRHRSPQTTSIYARVDIDAPPLALPGRCE
ncbi:MAG: tyrosine-type recombinase/integrase [Betaproteobacteria bacterium]|nr:tyrosine-type recombinase/integrase [Betaproteobacteria bacterium]